ncbi:STAS domain-containing protein [Patulibacter sp. SYSU D01012]|uniref:STAS domain-containing protein n=1 Tax=Patulibacter sp. SYSU D01012 TaxID=2817381 RepID=UPI001B315532|nr:STAS domain-containing protein [Patulibacter sp. SYSU D01012]
MELELEDHGDRRGVVRLTGRLDLVSAAALRAVVRDAVDDGRTGLVVDLAAVPFVDSSGLGALIGGLKSTRQAGGELRIAAPGEQVLSVLRLMRLDRVLRPYETVAEALDGL